MRLKDYQIPQYGLDAGLDAEDLKQYSLKNFDLKAYEKTQQQPDPAPIPASCDPYLFNQETDGASSWEPPNEPRFGPATNPVQAEQSPLALEPCDVRFGPHFNLQTVSYSPLSPAQSWKMPRWVVMTVGLFFGSAAVLTLAFCVVLLRDPNPAPAGPSVAPTPPVATTSAAPSERSSSPPIATADRAAVRHSSPATAKPMHDNSALRRRIVVSRHPTVVRRQTYGPRRVLSKRTSSSVAPQEVETASRRPPPDALDQLLSESSL